MLSLRFLICKMGITTVPTSFSYCEHEKDTVRGQQLVPLDGDEDSELCSQRSVQCDYEPLALVPRTKAGNPRYDPKLYFASEKQAQKVEVAHLRPHGSRRRAEATKP